MKKLLTLSFILLVSLVTYSQTNLSQEELAKLPIEVQNQIKSVKKVTETDAQIETVGKWVGLGKEVGYAFDGALTAVTTTAIKFSETKLGKITMLLVIYKVIGGDVIHLMFGILWVISILYIASYINRNFASDRRILTKETFNPETKKYDREWSIQSGDRDFRIGSTWVLLVGILLSIPIFLSI